MDLVDLLYKVGLYAGTAAFLILPFLIPLYVQQARDVRRLREWADLTPDRGTAEFQAAEAAGMPTPVPLVPAAAAAHARGDTAPMPAAQRVSQELPAAARATTTERVALPERRWHRFVRRPDTRYLVAIVAGVVLLGVGVGVLTIQMREDEPPVTSTGSGGQPAIVPGDVEIAVLNGTATPGLAGKVGDDLESGGFVIGAIGNIQAPSPRSEVVYQRGHEQEAVAVAERLGIEQVAVITPEIEEIVADASETSGVEPASVVVIAGEDRAGA